jgi:hypothetical protein
MRYAYGVVSVALVAVAATATGIACTGSNAENDGATQAAQQGLKPPGDPPGNNGTVKIQEAGSPDEIPDNDPHVGCIFNIEFRGYDEGDLHAQWSLAAQPPSGMGIPVTGGSLFIGGDPAGGANDLDGLVTVDLTKIDLAGLGLVEQPKQGFHLKLTVHAEGSKGADTKFKVFWVQGCFVPPPPEDGGTPPPPDGGQTW